MQACSLAQRVYYDNRKRGHIHMHQSTKTHPQKPLQKNSNPDFRSQTLEFCIPKCDIRSSRREAHARICRNLCFSQGFVPNMSQEKGDTVRKDSTQKSQICDPDFWGRKRGNSSEGVYWTECLRTTVRRVVANESRTAASGQSPPPARLNHFAGLAGRKNAIQRDDAKCGPNCTKFRTETKIVRMTVLGSGQAVVRVCVEQHTQETPDKWGASREKITCSSDASERSRWSLHKPNLRYLQLAPSALIAPAARVYNGTRTTCCSDCCTF